MKNSRSKHAGFTLIEVIATLVLTSLAAVFAGMLLTTSMRIYLLSRETAEDSQKVQAAMNRLVKELTWGESDLIGESTSIQWISFHPDQLGLDQTASWSGTSGDPLVINGVTLIDGVADFTVERVDTTKAISISLSSTRVPGISHETILYTRQ